MVIVDDIWHWQAWERISKALPRGNVRCILTTTRVDAIAENCVTKEGARIFRHIGIGHEDAAMLSGTILDADAPSLIRQKIADMSSGMPLAVRCLSLAVASLVSRYKQDMDLDMNMDMDELSSAVASQVRRYHPSHNQRRWIRPGTYEEVDQYSFARGTQRCLWQLVVDGILRNDLELRSVVESLRLGYDDLPVHLKTCLLYCSMCSSAYSSYKMERHDLVRKWIAEGFVYQDKEDEEEEEEAAAQACLDGLVSRGLLQPLAEEEKRHGLARKRIAQGFVYHDQDEEVKEGEAAAQACVDGPEKRSKSYCSVHPMMLAFLVCKSRETCFVSNFHEGHHSLSSSCAAGRIHRLSVGLQRQHVEWPDDLSSMDVTSTRSLVVFRIPKDDSPYKQHGGKRVSVGLVPRLHSPPFQSCNIPWEQLEHVRVLSIQGEGIPAGCVNVPDMCHRLHRRMRYLGFKGMQFLELPPQIGGLQNLETLDVSFNGVESLPIQIGKLQQLKSLNVSHTNINELPREIGKLQQLKSLNVSHANVNELPREIGELEQLKSLNVSHTNVNGLPKEIGKLEQLNSLNVSHTKINVLPREIGKLEHLNTLDLSYTKVRHLPRDIEKLQHLKTLDVSNTSVRELPWLLSNSVSLLVGTRYPAKAGKLSNNDLAVLRYLHEDTIKLGEDLTIMLYDHSYELLPVAGHKIVGRHMRVPEWVKQNLASASTLDIRICKLEDDDLEFLCQKMPKLQHLTLRLEVLPRKAIVITASGFSMLESFCLDCRLPMVTFQRRAKPKLEYLEFMFYTSRALTTEDPMGIRHLLSLKRVVFQSSPRYKSDAPGISAVINKVREEAKECHHRITISINGKDTTVFPVLTKTEDIGSDSSSASLVDRTIIEKRERALRAALMRAAAGQGKI